MISTMQRMADIEVEVAVSKNETSVTDKGELVFPRIKLRSMVRSTCRKKQYDNDECINTPKQKNTAKERMKMYRMRIKSCPELYELHKKVANERNKAYRASLSEEKKLHNKEKTRIRVKKWREKKKLEQALDNKQTPTLQQSSKPKTRNQCQKLREQWRKSKRKQRENMTSQKKRRVNEKRRQIYAEKREKKKQRRNFANTAQSSPIAVNVDAADEQNQLSKSLHEARRKAAYRAASEVKKSIPSSPTTFANFMSRLVRTTPRRRKALQKKGIVCAPRKLFKDTGIEAIKKELYENRKKRSHEYLQKRRLLLNVVHKTTNQAYKQMKSEFGVSWKFFLKASELEGVWEAKKRNDGLDVATVDKIETFFKSPGVSACMPDKKLVRVKEMEPRRIMDNTLKMAYEQFNKQNPDCLVGFSKFAALRPKSVKTMKNNYFNNCLCEYCSNMELKAAVLNKELKGNAGKLNKYELSKRTLCQKDGDFFYNKDCIERTCDHCGVQKLKGDLLEKLGSKKNITWKRWENQMYTDKSGKKTSRKMLRLKDHDVEMFVDELCDELTDYSGHLHNASWQHQQFTTLIRDIPKQWVVFCMDYSENYTCLYQDEAQSAHWSHDQVTLFSIVAYYNCTECSETVTESFIFVSNDKKHDCHAVHHFVTLANNHLTKTRNITIDHENHFSDGAASQFKSKTPFADVANSIHDFGFPCEKHFFGSRHGKGPCDGEFGVLKRTVSQFVVARKALVRDAKEFYDFAKEKLTKAEENGCLNHKRRTFFFVSESDVSRNRLDRINAKPIPDTRKLHAVRPCNEATLGVAVRTLSCFCAYCTGLATEVICTSTSHVSDWDWKSCKKTAKACKNTVKNPTCPKAKSKSTVVHVDISTKAKESTEDTGLKQ